MQMTCFQLDRFMTSWLHLVNGHRFLPIHCHQGLTHDWLKFKDYEGKFMKHFIWNICKYINISFVYIEILLHECTVYTYTYLHYIYCNSAWWSKNPRIMSHLRLLDPLDDILLFNKPIMTWWKSPWISTEFQYRFCFSWVSHLKKKLEPTSSRWDVMIVELKFVQSVEWGYPESGDNFYPVDLDGVVYDSFNLRTGGPELVAVKPKESSPCCQLKHADVKWRFQWRKHSTIRNYLCVYEWNLDIMIHDDEPWRRSIVIIIIIIFGVTQLFFR